MRLWLGRAVEWQQHVQHRHRLWTGSSLTKRLGELAQGTLVLHSFHKGAAPLLRNCKRSSKTVHLFSNPSLRLQAWRGVSQAAGRGLVRCITRQRAGLLLSAVCLAHKYDFEAHGISDAALDKYRDENQLSSVRALVEATVTCPVCQKRQVLHSKVPGVEYCECSEDNTVQWTRSYDGWVPFLEQQNILVWRKPHHLWPHLFAYKVYGRYDDVSLCAFTETQLSTSYRTQWDSSALDLHVLHSDEALLQKQQQVTDPAQGPARSLTYSAQDLLYWLVKFPRFFANRDYVFKRRYRADTQRREVVIVSEAAGEDSGVPGVAGVHRVHHYWSVMVLRATQPDFTKPGIEYVLSYFDNPGTSLPASITNYIASTAFPNFLAQLHTASLDLQQQYSAGQPVYTSLPRALMGLTTEDTPHSLPDDSSTSVGGQVTEGLGSRLGELESGAHVDTSTIVQLMEALGEMTTAPHDKSHLLQTLDAVINRALDNLDDTSPLFEKLKKFSKKIDSFRMRNEEKKAESLPVKHDQDLNHRNHRYDEARSSPELVQQLFETMRAVLKADRDMRTGKSLQCASDDDTLNLLDSNAKRKLGTTAASSPCDGGACSSGRGKEERNPEKPASDPDPEDDPPAVEPSGASSWTGWLYSVFIEKPVRLFKSSSKPEAKEADIDDSEEEGEKAESGSDCEAAEEQLSDEAPSRGSSVWYYVYGWFLWPVVNSVSSTERDQQSRHRDDALLAGDCATTPMASVDGHGASNGSPSAHSNNIDIKRDITDTDESCSKSSWYWAPMSATVRCGAWIYSYFTNSRL